MEDTVEEQDTTDGSENNDTIVQKDNNNNKMDKDGEADAKPHSDNMEEDQKELDTDMAKTDEEISTKHKMAKKQRKEKEKTHNTK